MAKPKVFVSRVIPEKGLESMREIAELEVWPDPAPPPYEVLREKATAIDGLVCLLTDRIDAELMAAAESLRVISQMAVGVDNIDLESATAAGLPVGHIPGVLTETTADFAFALLMCAARRVVEGVEYVRAGRWQTWEPTLLMGRDIHGATLGIIGLGRIGQAVARRAAGFEMEVIYYDESVDAGLARAAGAKPRSFGQVLEQSDFLSLHVPLTANTEHMIGEAELAAMRPSAILINTSRGAVVDPAALYRALDRGEIAYAALDVTEPEPIPPDDPLLTLDNCLVVPHMASSSLATRNKMAAMAAANLAAGLEGRPLPNCANPEVYR